MDSFQGNIWFLSHAGVETCIADIAALLNVKLSGSGKAKSISITMCVKQENINGYNIDELNLLQNLRKRTNY